MIIEAGKPGCRQHAIDSLPPFRRRNPAQHERQMVKFIGRDLRHLLLERLQKFGKRQ